jgi:hypothetical protein
MWSNPMRNFLVISLLAAAGPAFASPPQVEVRVGDKLQVEAARSLGVADVDQLATDLKKHVERELDRTGVMAGGRIELILVDARPNRPTFKQLNDHPGLSLASFGTGGARIEGRAIAVDGAVTPIRYEWYETDIRNTPYLSTWSNADTSIDQFARRLARGDAVDRR